MPENDGASLPRTGAGLREWWHDEEGAGIKSRTIVLTDANALVRTIHDRMPVILAREDYGAWLDPGNPDADGFLDLLKPTPPDQWALHPVSRLGEQPA